MDQIKSRARRFELHQALRYVRYLADRWRGRGFIAEDVRMQAIRDGVEFSLVKSDWGPVLQAAAREGAITANGTVSDMHRKYGRTTLWRAN